MRSKETRVLGRDYTRLTTCAPDEEVEGEESMVSVYIFLMKIYNRGSMFYEWDTEVKMDFVIETV